ncbi:MAG TPA: hypothetical protein VFG22_09250 [Polyangiales bacterium]|nr:hypothetical protein [Polyangiales bacterium]
MPVVTEAQIEAARFKTFESAASFNRAVADFADSIGPTMLVPFHKKLHLQGLRGIVQKTPVDTGRARGNWQSSRDIEPVGELGIRSGGDAVSEGVTVTRTLAPYTVSYITNNLPYIEFLEAGGSDQTPAGMVSVTITELETQFP